MAALTVAVLVVNAGSSSLKLRLLDDRDDVLASEDLPDVDHLPDGALARAVARFARSGTITAIGHRIVHGGVDFTQPTVIDDAVTARLRELTDLAPLHQPKSLAALDAVSRSLPGIPAVACFDTAFHAGIPPAAHRYAVPREWHQRYGVRKYGFHGLSHAYCAGRVADMLGRRRCRLVSCHLGAGASLAAVVDGRCVDTTMGFTPLDGLIMATRSGSVDPGLVLWLTEHEHLRPHEIGDALEHRSGLLALAGTSDMRQVQALAIDGDADAQLGLDAYVHRLVTSIGAMAAAAGGLDALAFTGGVGENSAAIRDMAARRLGHLGIVVDAAANSAARPDADITGDAARARTMVIAAREDLFIARETRRALRRPTRDTPHPTASR
jgi:acetate kinase